MALLQHLRPIGKALSVSIAMDSSFLLQNTQVPFSISNPSTVIYIKFEVYRDAVRKQHKLEDFPELAPTVEELAELRIKRLKKLNSK